MSFRRALTWAACLVACAIEATELIAQPVRVIPRPPAQAPGPPKSGGRQRRAGRLRADSRSGWDKRARHERRRRRVRRRDRRRRTDGRVLLQFPSRRPHHRRRASGPHQDRRQGRQGLGADRRDAGRICGLAAGRACSRSGPIGRSRRIARSTSPTPCCPTARIPRRCRAAPASSSSRARSSRRTTSGSTT